MIVAIKNDYYGSISEPIRNLIKDWNDIRWRTERVPEYLLNHPEFECTQEYDWYRRFRVGNTIIMLEEVDASRPWTILDYDGAEYIQYLDFDIVDAESNYCKLKKE